ncbi:MAG: bifunctional adenosylcobinamide kinase/adenosylcobinamide-phosphate guanylyltransferase [Cyanobacteria bacterium J06635_15]
MMTVPLSVESLPEIGQITLITGPARSGKSEWAEALAIAVQKPIVYIATSQLIPNDHDWQQRIEQHRQRRPATWLTQEVPYDLAQAIQSASPNQCLLVDSLGTWLANRLEQSKSDWQLTQTELVQSLQSTPVQVILVAEETGWGVVPAYEVGRLFRDRLGEVTRKIGAIADAVYLVTAGYALNLSQLGHPVPPQS